MHEAITSYLAAHPKDFEFHTTEVPYNPYLRDADGNQFNWHVAITYVPTKAQFRCHFSAEENVVNLALVLDVVRGEIMMLNGCETPEEYATCIGLPQNDAMDARDVHRIHRTAVRHREEFIEAFGPAAEYLLGYKEIKSDDGLGFW